MVALWIALGATALAASAVLIAATVCYVRMFHSPDRRMPGPGEYDFPDGDVYIPFYDDMRAWTDMIRAYPSRDYAIESFETTTSTQLKK